MMALLVNNVLHEDKISDFNVGFSSSKCGRFQVQIFKFSHDLNGFEGVINDHNGHKMKFLFRPTERIELSRTLIILHGHGANKVYSKFYDKNWNVIIPLDEYGAEGLGSWWLGENGDFRTYYLLQNLIKILRDYFKTNNLYFWGSSMGGYGAIVHGFVLQAFAVYAHIPQIKLKDTDYTEGSNSKYYTNILSDYSQSYSDLSRFIKRYSVRKSPILFLSQNSMDRPNYVRQHFFPFLETCDLKGFAYSVHMPLIKGHTQHISVFETVKNVFENNYPKIRKWRIDGII